ncbi:hypothetical protein O181_013380 [Austropuccinia psidii MF-1]|uniref:Uncharacterized protein n=1 Tax=Austropuccinia psidii MF-1 TaxID=1389203 RepID=A0A9Q3GNV5_9BASI|nr:hypothetical protein [Austropuccinia psidii MF-1]
MCKSKRDRGKGYTSGASCIKLILMKNVEAKVNFDTAAFQNCLSNNDLHFILPKWQTPPLPTDGIQLSIDSNNIYPLGMLETNLVFPHPACSVRMEIEILVMDNCTSQNIILTNDSLNIYGIDINNHKDRYFTIGENRRKKNSFSDMPKPISVVSSNKNTYME